MPPITTFLNRLLALTIELQNILFTAFEQLLTARIEGAIASGTYDVGLETLRAESFVVTDRRTIYAHPATGAETRLLTITQRERNRPVSLDDALDRLSDHRAVLLINERSGRAAVQIPAPSFMLDDGEIERRVRLIRPMEQHSVPLKMMAESHWVEADRERFAAAWLAELAEVPEFTESTIHVVAGLLLPIWKRLPNESTRVYRLQTDAGERIIGRKVSAAWVANALAADAPKLTPDAAFAALMEGTTVLDLAEGLQLRRVRVMGAHRIELSGFTDTMRDRLRAYGLFGEIISWKLRMFVPIGRERRRDPGEGARPLSDRAHRRTGGRVMSPRCRRTGTSPRARGRGGVPPLSLQRQARGALLAGRRRPQYAGPLDVCASTGRRRRAPPANGPTPRPASMAISSTSSAKAWACVDFREVAEEARRFLSLPRSEPELDPKSACPPAPTGSQEAARRLFAISGRLRGPSSRRICSDAELPTCTMVAACAFIRAATIGPTSTCRPKPGRQ